MLAELFRPMFNEITTVHILSLVCAFLSTFAAFFASAFYREAAVQAIGSSEAKGYLALCLLGYVFAVLGPVSFMGFDVESVRGGRPHSLVGFLAALAVSFAVFCGFASLLWRLRANPYRLRVAYVLLGATVFLLSHFLFRMFSQNLPISAVNWFVVCLVYLTLVGALFVNSRNLRLTDDYCLFESYSGFRGILGFSIVNVALTLAFEWSISPESMVPDPDGALLPLSPLQSKLLKAFGALCLISFFANHLYGRLQDMLRVNRLHHERYQEEINSYKRRIQRAKEQADEDTHRIQVLSEQVNHTQSEIAVPAESLVSAVLALEEGIFEWDLEHDRLKLSHSWRTLMGFENHDDPWIALEDWRARFINSDLIVLDEALDHLFSGVERVARFQMRFEQDEGGILKIEFKLASVINAYGLVTKLVGLMEDRTAEMLVEMDVRDNLSEESRLSSRKSEFVTYLSHQIRTPMTVIGSANALMQANLRHRTLNEQRVNNYVDQVDYALQLLRSLVDETLIFIGSENVVTEMHHDELIDVKQLFNEVLAVEIKRRSQSLPEGFQVRQEIPEVFEVISNEMLLSHVFRQFVSFVFDNPEDAKGMFIYSDKTRLYLQVLYSSVPTWVTETQSVKEDTASFYESCAQILQIEEDRLPFALLLSKRVIRNLKGRLILRRIAEQLSMTVEVPVTERGRNV